MDDSTISESSLGEHGGGHEERLAAAIAEFVDLVSRGEKVPLGDFLARYPDLPELARELSVFVDIQDTVDFDRALGTLGDYRILRQVGRGGMGIVYEAWQTSLDRRVALKVLPAGLLTDKTAVARFEREAKVAARLHHPNIVSVYGLGVESGSPYFAMEFVDGESLDRVLKRLRSTADTDGVETAWSGSSNLFSASSFAERELDGSSGEGVAAFSESSSSGSSSDLRRMLGARLQTEDPTRAYALKVAHAFAGAAEGIHHAHTSGVVHRDIKPSNLILEPDGRLRVLDFGLARLEGQDQLTVSGEFLGTPVYMSPEQARKEDLVDHQSDVYSLGATLYEVLVWKPPFRGRDHQETLHQILHREPRQPRARNSKIPRDLETIVLKCLRKNSTDRYLTAEALAQDLRRFVRGQPIEARPQSWIEHASRRIWSNRGKIAVSVAVLLLVLTTSLLIRARWTESNARLEAEYEDVVTRSLMVTRFIEPLDATREEASSSLPPHAGLAELIVSSGLGWKAADEADAMEGLLAKLELAVDQFPERPDAHYQLARMHAAAGEFAEALAALSEILSHAESFVPALHLRSRVQKSLGDEAAAASDLGAARSFAREGWSRYWLDAELAREERRWEEAADAFGRLKEIVENAPPYLGSRLDARLGRGTALLAAGKFDAALVEFAEAKALWTEWPEPIFLLGKTLHRKGDTEAAAACFDELYARSPRKGDAAFGAAQIYRDFGVYDRALAWNDRMRESAVKSRLRADLLIRLQRYDKALGAADDAILRDSSSPLAEILRGDALCGLGDVDRGVESYRRALQKDSENARAYYHLGWALLYRKQDYRAAAEALERAVELNPNLTTAHHALAVAHEESGALRRAVSRHQLAMRMSSSAHLHSAYASMLERNGQIERSLHEFERRARDDPHDVNAQLDLARVLRRYGEEFRASQLFLEIQRRHPNNFEAAFETSIREGSLDEAGSTLLSVARLAADDPRPFLKLAAREEAQGLVGRAESFYRKGIQAIPGSAELRFSLARLLQRERRLDEADELLDEALDIDPAHTEAACMRALRLVALGRNSDAVQLLQSNLEVEQSDPALELLGRILRSDPKLADRDRLRALAERRLVLIPGPTESEYRSIDRRLEEPEVLIPKHALWRALVATSAPGRELEWTAPGFDDADWLPIVSPVGYGDRQVFSSLGSPGTANTLFLRKKFSFAESERFDFVEVRVCADDGFVAYLNGREIGRARVEGKAGEPVPDGALALLGPREPVVDVIRLRPEELMSGANQLSLIVLNWKPDSRDLLARVEVVAHLDREALRRREDSLIEQYRVPDPATSQRRAAAYLEARVRERRGEVEAAKDAYRELFEIGEFQRLAPWKRYIELVASSGDTEAEVTALELALSQLPEIRTPALKEFWERWFRLCVDDLGLSIEKVRARLPRSTLFGDEGLQFGYRADLAWLLDELAAGRALRWNCAGDAYTGSDGRQWASDRFFVGGHRGAERWGVPARLELSIAGTDDDFLYQSHRWWGRVERRNGYRVPLPRGSYRVVYHVGATTDNVTVPRRFDVLVGKQVVLPGVQVLGFRKAYRFEFEVDLEEPFLHLSMRPISWDPAIGALEIYPLEK